MKRDSRVYEVGLVRWSVHAPHASLRWAVPVSSLIEPELQWIEQAGDRFEELLKQAHRSFSQGRFNE